LDRNEAVIVIATAEHCSILTNRLEAEGLNVGFLERKNHLICIDAEDLIGQFMVDGMPDRKLFTSAIERIVSLAKRGAGRGRERKIRAIGEMVSLLWRSDTAAALKLEDLWNEVIETHQLALLCTYSLDGTAAHSSLPECLAAPHSSNLASCSLMRPD
jgi:hypothetical protein